MLEELRKQLEAKLAMVAKDEPAPIFAGRQFLVFRADKQEMLIAVDDVREIIMPPPISFLPRSPTEIEGVIALRGEIMPVINLRRMLGFDRAGLSSSTRCLVASPNQQSFALIVDELTEFVWLLDEEIDSVAQDYLSDEFKIVRAISKNANVVRPIVDINLVVQAVFRREQFNEQNAH
jgi:chemotaxis signal transduction protein